MSENERLRQQVRQWQLENWTLSQDWVYWTCMRLGMPDDVNGEPTHVHRATKTHLQAFAELAIETERHECATAIKELVPSLETSAEAQSRAALEDVLAMIKERGKGRPVIPPL